MSSDRAAALAATLALLGCSDCVPAREAVRGTRVIGVENTPRVASPGGVVRVRAVAVDGPGRDVRVSWFRCQRPLASLFLTAMDLTPRQAEAEIYANCFARGEMARGVEIDLTIDPEGGPLDPTARTDARRWTHLIGAACGGEDVEAPAMAGMWPRCRGGPAFVFLASIPGPTLAGSSELPPPPRIGAVTLQLPSGETRAWSDDDRPVVPRCEFDPCPEVTVNVAVEGTSVRHFAVGSQPVSNARDDRAPYLGWFVQASHDEVFTEGCPAIRFDSPSYGLIRWRTPRVPGELRFSFWIPTAPEVSCGRRARSVSCSDRNARGGPRVPRGHRADGGDTSAPRGIGDEGPSSPRPTSAPSWTSRRVVAGDGRGRTRTPSAGAAACAPSPDPTTTAPFTAPYGLRSRATSRA